MNAPFWKTKRIREGKAWILKLASSLAMEAKLPPGVVPPPGVGFSGGKRFPIAISIVDREPWRCRRTDGKKWRCQKAVVPTYKYCDRHINRGRKSSRKSTEEGSPPAAGGRKTPTPTPMGIEVSAGNQSQGSSSTTSFIFIPVSAEPQHPPSFTNTSSRPATSHLGTKITGSTVNNIDVLSRENPTTENVDVQVTVRNKESSSGIFKLKGIHDNDPGRKNYCSSSTMNSKDIINRGGRTSLNNHNTHHSCASQWLDFSPRIVLQARGCGASSFDGGDTGLEPERCRRTDGKKWRCGRQVVTNSKYCGMHSRGRVRSYLEAAQPRPRPASSGNASSAAVPPTVSLPKKATDHPRLSTNLSISIPGSPLSSRSETTKWAKHTSS